MQLIEQIGMVLLVFALLGGLLWFSKRRGLASFALSGRRGGNAQNCSLTWKNRIGNCSKCCSRSVVTLPQRPRKQHTH